MKKTLALVPLISLLVPFAALAADANAGVQINAVDSSGKAVHVETTYDSDGSPIFHLDSSGGASVGGGSDDAMEHARTNENAEEHMSATGSAAVAAHVTGEADDHVKNVDVKGDEVNFDYVGHGKFLGVFDLAFTTKVHVMPSSDGNTVETKVDLPWWSFLISGAAEVKSAINAIIQSNAEMNASGSASAGTN